MMYEKCKIIILPTNDKLGSIKVHKETNKMYGPKMIISNQLAYRFHIYICIKKYINTDDLVYSYKENKLIRYNGKDKHDVRYKVIATTDESLNMPELSDDFIYKFVRLNGNINEILVEYQELTRCTTIENNGKDYIFRNQHLIDEIDKNKSYHLFGPVVNMDNTINIYPIKNNFTFKEVYQLLMNYGATFNNKTDAEKCKNWLIKNM